MKKPSLNYMDFIVIGLVGLAMMAVHQTVIAPRLAPKTKKV